MNNIFTNPIRRYFGALTLILALFFMSLTSLQAQQDAMFTQYMFNTIAINPAYAGNQGYTTITALYRNQWVRIPGAPDTQTISFDTPIPNKNIGLGFSIINDKIGVTRTTGINAYYSYQIPFNDNSMLSFGLQAGVSNYRGDFTSVRHSPDVSSPDVAFGTNVNEFLPNFGAGIFYNTNKFYIGLSIPHMINNQLSDKKAVSITERARQSRHAFLMTGYVFSLKEHIKLKPSILVKYVDGAPLEVDFNANVWFFDMIGLGASLRTGDSFDLLAELQIDRRIRIGYAYDYTLTNLTRYNSGSHEIMLRYQFSFEKTRIITPRYF